jgi:hypothetical protein
MSKTIIPPKDPNAAAFIYAVREDVARNINAKDGEIVTLEDGVEYRARYIPLGEMQLGALIKEGLEPEEGGAFTKTTRRVWMKVKGQQVPEGHRVLSSQELSYATRKLSDKTVDLAAESFTGLRATIDAIINGIPVKTNIGNSPIVSERVRTAMQEAICLVLREHTDISERRVHNISIAAMLLAVSVLERTATLKELTVGE